MSEVKTASVPDENYLVVCPHCDGENEFQCKDEGVKTKCPDCFEWFILPRPL